MSRKKLSGSRVATRPGSCGSVRNQLKRVMRELEAVTSDNPRQADPIVEQLKQCPEAFKAGEMIGKMLDSLKYSQGHAPAGDRYLPPAGAIVPPLA
jgi:hypothetical protein